MPLTKDFYQGTPGKDMALDPAINAYVGVTMDGIRVEVSKEDFEAIYRNYHQTNLAVWWLVNQRDKVKSATSAL